MMGSNQYLTRLYRSRQPVAVPQPPALRTYWSHIKGVVSEGTNRVNTLASSAINTAVSLIRGRQPVAAPQPLAPRTYWSRIRGVVSQGANRVNTLASSALNTIRRKPPEQPPAPKTYWSRIKGVVNQGTNRVSSLASSTVSAIQAHPKLVKGAIATVAVAGLAFAAYNYLGSIPLEVCRKVTIPVVEIPTVETKLGWGDIVTNVFKAETPPRLPATTVATLCEPTAYGLALKNGKDLVYQAFSSPVFYATAAVAAGVAATKLWQHHQKNSWVLVNRDEAIQSTASVEETPDEALLVL